jgi:ATPase family AAA domain-containing protein 3A/B
MGYTSRLVAASFSFPFIGANWLHQCSQCVDQSLYSDMSLKTDIRSANTSQLYDQMKSMQLREFEHIEKEFFNRFFSRSQLGLVAQELQNVCPAAVSMIPERRYTSANGTQVSSKNILMIRESHVLFVILGGLQEVSRKIDAMDRDYWSRTTEWDNSLSKVHEKLTAVTEKSSDVEKSIFLTGTKVAYLTEQSEATHRAIRSAEDRISEAKGLMGALNEKFTLTAREQGADILDLRSSFVKTNSLVESKLTTIDARLSETSNAVVGLSSVSDSLDKRLRAIESVVFNLLNERKSLKQEIISYDRNRFAWIRLLLRLEHQRTAQRFSRGRYWELSKEETERLAIRREEFDTKLVLMKEEADLRILREKAIVDSQAAERQLKFEKEKLGVEMAVRIEQARIDSEMRLRDKRENEDVNMRELAERNLAEKNRMTALIQETAGIISNWVRELYATPENLLLAIGSIVGLVGGIYVAKEGAHLAREEISRRLGKPQLVRVSSRRTIWEELFVCKKRKASLNDAFKDVVLPQNLADQIRRLAQGTRSAILKKSSLLNMMFYGEPGTGKTMVAKRFAEFSGLDYAIMSGGDIAPLGAEAVTEIHKLFKWVHASRRGLVLFIDEAESFLAQRTGAMSENLRNAITALLYHTGTASSRFMMIIATNRPGDLDTAIIDRVDERIEFPLPNLEERRRLIQLYWEGVFGNPNKGLDETCLGKIALKTKGFSGREISKLMLSVHSHAEMAPGCSLTEFLMSTTEAKVREHERMRSVAKTGYSFDRSTLDASDSEQVL